MGNSKIPDEQKAIMYFLFSAFSFIDKVILNKCSKRKILFRLGSPTSIVGESLQERQQ